MFHPNVKGMQNLPAEGPYILAPNHQSFLDGPMVVAYLEKSILRQTYFYAKREHVKNPLSRFVANNHNVVVMDMRTLKESICQLAEILKHGGNLVIFPEGTRTKDGTIGTFKKTFAILSKELQVPIVPVRIIGAFEALPRTRNTIHPNKIRVEYLKPVYPGDSSYELLVEEVRNAILKK